MKSQSGLSRFVALLPTLAGIACITLLAGCGQKGPLYMPGSKPVAGQSKKSTPTIPPATPAPAVPSSNTK
nr:lipoprotein [Janthinobacterium sp. Marseille]